MSCYPRKVPVDRAYFVCIQSIYMSDLVEKAFGITTPADIAHGRANSSAVVEAIRAYDDTRLVSLPRAQRKRILELLADWATHLELHAHPLNLTLPEVERVLRGTLENRRRQPNRAHGEKPGETEALQSFFDFLVTMREQEKEVSKMDEKPSKRGDDRRTPPTPPKMTKAEWMKRDRSSVTLTRGEFEQLARLIGAGHVMLRNEPSVSPKLKAAMTRLGITTKGL
jgi:hypothetical protein